MDKKQKTGKESQRFTMLRVFQFFEVKKRGKQKNASAQKNAKKYNKRESQQKKASKNNRDSNDTTSNK